MDCYLGIDIGTFETKGVLADGEGRILATAKRRHDMIVPQPGWAEHDAENEEDDEEAEDKDDEEVE